MEILALPGSVRNGSYNTALLNAMSDHAPTHFNVTLYDKLGSIPIFNPENPENTIPASVSQLIDQLRNADGVIISAPEYAHGVSGVLKNTLDWLVASDALVLKPVVICSVSTSNLGGARSFCSLVQILSAMNANVVIDASLCVPFAKIKFDQQSQLTDEITIEAVKLSLLALERAINLAK